MRELWEQKVKEDVEEMHKWVGMQKSSYPHKAMEKDYEETRRL
jgi:hypothetical protein